MDKCTIFRQVSEEKLKEENRITKWNRSNGVSFQKKIKQGKKSKPNFKQSISDDSTSYSTIYVQPPSFSKDSSYDKDNSNTIQKTKRRRRSVQEEDNIGTDQPTIPGEKKRDSMSSITVATAVSSGVSSTSSSSSYC